MDGLVLCEARNCCVNSNYESCDHRWTHLPNHIGENCETAPCENILILKQASGEEPAVKFRFPSLCIPYHKGLEYELPKTAKEAKEYYESNSI